jgi:hypothetical protein
MSDIVALSGGKDSTAMALWLAENEPRDYDYICTPTGNEPVAMIEHWLKLGRILGKPIKPVTMGKSLAGLIEIQNCLPNHRMRWCTRMLKIIPFQRYILEHLPCTVYVGIRADEVREGVDHEMELLVRTRYPLAEAGMGISAVTCLLERFGVIIPERTDCELCFFQTLWEWYVLWRDRPASFAEGIRWEDMTEHTLRSDQRDSWPASLRQLGTCFALGMIPGRRGGMESRRTMCSVCAR